MLIAPSRVVHGPTIMARTLATVACVGAVFLAASCGDDEEGGGAPPPPPPTPAEKMCGLIKDAIEGCAGASPCDQALVADCAGLAAILSDPYLKATADCIEAGGTPLACLTASTSALAPTDAHRAFASKFCSDCLFGVPGCEDAFFGGGGETAIAGALILPFGDELVTAIGAECAGGLQCATFPSCAQGVLAQQAIPDATLSCLVDNLIAGGGGDPSGDTGGNCTAPTGTQTGTGTGTGTGACGARTYGECTACSEATCCNEMLACDDGTACGNLVTCLNQCQDQACVQGCNSAHPDGIAPLNTWDTCMASGCIATGACGLGNVCNTGFISYGGGACDTCMGSACCQQIYGCLGEDFNACTDCLSGAGPCSAAATAVLDCQTNSCQGPCTSGG